MAKLFDGLVTEGLYYEWASLLDWMFDDEKVAECEYCDCKQRGSD